MSDRYTISLPMGRRIGRQNFSSYHMEHLRSLKVPITKSEKNIFKKILEDELSCSICLEVLKKPSILECGHLFCKTCIEKCISSSHLNCPICRKLSVLNSSFYSQRLEELISILQSSISQNSDEKRNTNNPTSFNSGYSISH
ncbi:E3 ubiquitin-protein ligase TRIM31-like isoform X2 [Daktulosphaira vitifoliae]|uniref:E3 ubiquitin-protein ligase TRIM31-like isoform X2 n=1 Tax=Daktulosphaira vitifoliae TaxID=58002 RepID=UPI0021AAAB7F|nr:E3 ubiquitin-protein ligase TRIM31-like isoform X2 [Daktulosphaira vitifoliae]